MGQHKTNITAIKAKRGELPPKAPREKIKYSLEDACYTAIVAAMENARYRAYEKYKEEET